MVVEKKHVCTGHRAAVYALAPGSDARHVLSAGGDGWIVSWDLDAPETGQLVASVETRVFALCTLPGGKRLVAGNMNGGIHWIDLEHPEATRNVQHHQKGVFDLIHADGSVFSAGGEGTLTRWNPETGRSVESYQLSNKSLRSIAWAPGRRVLAVGASDGAIYLLDSDTLALRHSIATAHPPSVFTLAWSPDERCLLSGGRDAMLRVWDASDDFRLLSEQAAHWFTVNHLVFSPDGTLFATASRDKTIKIWDTASFQLLKVIDVMRYGAHLNSVNRLLWLPDCLVSGSDDRSLMLWQVN